MTVARVIPRSVADVVEQLELDGDLVVTSDRLAPSCATSVLTAMKRQHDASRTNSSVTAGWDHYGPDTPGNSSPQRAAVPTAPGTASSSSARSAPWTPIGAACWQWKQLHPSSGWPSGYRSRRSLPCLPS